ncbi:hypothetical protein B0H12DRAFT_269886 [Mycena haematopus]|nr:hypothetical protein B0H12DRAFT_269886 [Mycena haematopus]
MLLMTKPSAKLLCLLRLNLQQTRSGFLLSMFRLARSAPSQLALTPFLERAGSANQRFSEIHGTSSHCDNLRGTDCALLFRRQLSPRQHGPFTDETPRSIRMES